MAEEKTKEEQDLQNRLYQSIAFEVGANTAVDFATGWLMPAPPVYAGVNFVAGGAINTLAQLWRQDDNFSWGEVGASSAIGIVPGLGGKGVTGIARATAKGAGLGVAHEAIRVGVDEQRLLTPEEVAGGALIGGTFGGGTKVVGDSVGVLAKHQTDKIANRKAKGFYNRPGDPYVDRTDIWKPDDLTGPQKTYTKGMEKRPYPPEYGRANWDWYSQSGVSAADQLKNRGMKRSVPEEILEAADLQMSLENAIDGIDITPNPNRFKATEFTGRAGGMIDKFLGQQGKIKDVQNIIDAMDDWRIDHASSQHPMTGFTKHFGRKPTIIIDGQEHVIGWSRKANKGKGRYTIRNLEAQKAVQRSRIEKNLTSNASEAEKVKIQELIRRDMNLKSKNLSPDQWDLLIQNPGDAYIEHFISVKSPFWQSTRGKNAGYKAGDLRNRKILGDQNFKTLKDNVEKHVHAKHKDLYVDYDPISQNIVLKRLDTGKAISNTQIPGYGKATDWKRYVDDSIADSGIMPIEDVHGIEKRLAPANIQRDIDSSLFKGLTDVEKDAIIDRVNGASWNQIKKDYGNSLKQMSLIKKTYSNLTPSQVSRIMKAYNLDGKGWTQQTYTGD